MVPLSLIFFSSAGQRASTLHAVVYTNIIIEEADRLRDLVDRMLGPRTLPQTEEINIHEVLERVCQLVDVESEHQIEIIRDYDPSIPEMEADRGQMVQALLNVCRNAMQAMDVMEDDISLVFKMMDL